MAVRKGEAWGAPAPLPAGAALASSDRELVEHARPALQAGAAGGPFGLVGGDLCATLGGRGDIARLTSAEAHTLPCDVGRVRWDGGEDFFAAHCVARSWPATGTWFAAMNAAWLGSRNVAPRAHPGDGRLDVVTSTLNWPDRLKARRRIIDGSHVPHPDISMKRTAGLLHSFDRPTTLFVDGIRRGRVRSIEVEILPEVLLVVV